MPDIARPLVEVIPSMPEVIPRPEVIEHNKETASEEIQTIETSAAPQKEVAIPEIPSTTASTSLVAPMVKSPVRRDIEKVLEEDLKFLYSELSSERKIMFRQQGELTASRIEYLMGQATMKIGYIVQLIRRWLSLLPGVNFYYLEQESKIKAEKILFLKTKE
ncbi:MAG: hypothetical protein AAB870_00290 [Patescibacteria group bacterium]